MGIFKSKFFSIAGQKERFANVGAVLKQSFNPFSKAKPVANVASKPLKSVLEWGASHPYTSAGLVAGGVVAAKAPAAVASKVASVVKAHPVKAAGATVVAGVVATSPKARKTVTKVASKATPEELLSTGGKIGTAIEEEQGFSSFTDIAKGAGLVAGGVALGAGALVVGGKVLEKIKGGAEDTPSLPVENTLLSEGKPAVQQTDLATPVLPETTQITTGAKRRRRASKKKSPSIRQSVRVNVNNRASVSKRYINTRYIG